MVGAAAHLLAGDLVAFPTETVYGLGADACNAAAVARIYSVKGRPADHPLIVHVASKDALGDWASDVPAFAIALARDLDSEVTANTSKTYSHKKAPCGAFIFTLGLQTF